jgi:hypothetical protein
MADGGPTPTGIRTPLRGPRYRGSNPCLTTNLQPPSNQTLRRTDEAAFIATVVLGQAPDERPPASGQSREDRNTGSAFSQLSLAANKRPSRDSGDGVPSWQHRELGRQSFGGRRSGGSAHAHTAAGLAPRRHRAIPKRPDPSEGALPRTCRPLSAARSSGYSGSRIARPPRTCAVLAGVLPLR